MTAVKELKSPTEAELRKRVRRGIGLLNVRLPGWKTRVQLSKLDLGDCHRCALSQVLGMQYDDAQELLGLSDEDAVACGFELSIDHREQFYWTEYTRLTSAWLAELNKL